MSCHPSPRKMRCSMDFGISDFCIWQRRKVRHAQRQKDLQHFLRLPGVLLDYAPDKKSKGKEEAPILSDEQFEEMYQGVLAALDKKSALSQEMSAAGAEIERVKAWGDFAPAELKELKEAGYDLHFYRLAKMNLRWLSRIRKLK